jgi:hypothetical protein
MLRTTELGGKTQKTRSIKKISIHAFIKYVTLKNIIEWILFFIKRSHLEKKKIFNWRYSHEIHRSFFYIYIMMVHTTRLSFLWVSSASHLNEVSFFGSAWLNIYILLHSFLTMIIVQNECMMLNAKMIYHQRKKKRKRKGVQQSQIPTIS